MQSYGTTLDTSIGRLVIPPATFHEQFVYKQDELKNRGACNLTVQECLLLKSTGALDFGDVINTDDAIAAHPDGRIKMIRRISRVSNLSEEQFQNSDTVYDIGIRISDQKYEELPGIESTREELQGLLDRPLTVGHQVYNHPIWTALVEQSILKKYVTELTYYMCSNRLKGGAMKVAIGACSLRNPVIHKLALMPITRHSVREKDARSDLVAYNQTSDDDRYLKWIFPLYREF